MKKIIRSLVVVAMTCLAGVMAGCGSGGDSTAAVDTATGTELKLTLSVAAAPAGSLIGGVQGKIAVPEGCSVRSAATGETSAGVFSASGNAASSLASAKFTPATRIVNYAVVNASGFSGGDFATLLVQVPAGSTVKAADFTLSESLVVDTGPNTLIGPQPLNLAITVK